MSDPLKPNASLLCKLVSIAVHASEGLSTGGHAYDIQVLKQLLVDQEVDDWIKSMTKLGMAPVIRKRG